ncbi:MAG TPA: glyoxalase [Methyloceanibacter sp.]|nr:glyoxalase [Methyloceanibacter sp.]
MPVLKVRDLAFARLRAPDLDAAEEFLDHFGMIKVERTPTALYYRGTEPAHHIHITEKAESPSFAGLAYELAVGDDLKRAAKLPGASGIETIDEPGGGKRVRLTEPNGYTIELVHGIARHERLPLAHQKLNIREERYSRVGEVMRIKPGAAHVMRIGHAVLASPRVRETVAWFREMLGLVGSDDVYAGTKDNLIGSFNRLDRGDDYVDHHVFFCITNPKAGLNHLSFEVPDIDDVFMGHHHLKHQAKYDHMWGIGRHLLGSQVYDYWADPWGRVHEHWADTDRLNASTPMNVISAEEGLTSQWGEPPPQRFIELACP